MSSIEKSALECLASAIYSAVHRDLPECTHRVPDTQAMNAYLEAHGTYAKEPILRTISYRPQDSEIMVRAMFVSTWGSRALGFKAVLSQSAMTPAYTVVLQGPDGHFAVYFAGRFAYLVDPVKVREDQLAAFHESLAKGFLEHQHKAPDLYGATY